MVVAIPMMGLDFGSGERERGKAAYFAGFGTGKIATLKGFTNKSYGVTTFSLILIVGGLTTIVAQAEVLIEVACRNKLMTLAAKI
ncbi:MAG: hypothetical protein KJ077_11830 [Anaerolineae bacterium]|nr:hypothetical protein [Anaerolineae bacterium]